ncbi:bifunctional 2-polyprenyl-6-hydroxyphenol methylase/3-demethylubiquinol 3-O-methyltransferase UbiG [Paenibacillus sp. FSL H7-0331]|uniref:class I SAM-dependent methyltransferase n=1 Tax=Paenibacillus sp. FSL H7-0331 TaxID=1920421 RepID=UPI00096C4086|nr:methyltransferase domain-containing protein [Paenibacillus sp. FSL H7-0331]OMF08595.1 hypothetical protein BK127_28410 [Paenibacillus sp. FSL H7-0331]
MVEKITPGFIMNQIRNGVRSQKKTIEEIKLEQATLETEIDFKDEELSQIFSSLQVKLKRLNYRITANIPVAFLEPHLVSRFKFLGKIIVPIRRIGTRLFTKWYADTFINQQKQLNNDIWFGLNSAIEIINEQNKVILHLTNKNIELTNKVSESLLTGNELANKTTVLTTKIMEIDQNAVLYRDELGTKIQTIADEYKKNTVLDFNYSKFAERFSADRETVKEIYLQYIPYLKDCNYVLDIGCGKGYFLELLRDHEIEGVGVDSDPELVRICTDKGLSAHTNDAIKYLESLNDNSVGGIFTGHVVEHLPAPLKIHFLKLCLSKLSLNGVLIIETPNTTSPYVMHNLYYLDPTHEKPMFHETYKYIAVDVGFSVINSYLSGPIDGTDPQEYYNFSLILSKQ